MGGRDIMPDICCLLLLCININIYYALWLYECCQPVTARRTGVQKMCDVMVIDNLFMGAYTSEKASIANENLQENRSTPDVRCSCI